MAGTAKRKRTTRSRAKPKYDPMNRPMRSGDAHTVSEAFATADYAADGMARWASVTIRSFGEKEGSHPDTSLEIRCRRYDLRPGDDPRGSISDYRENEVSTEYAFFADEIETIARALMEAASFAKAMGVIPEKPYTGPTPPPAHREG